MSRRTLTDKQWSRIEKHLPGRAGTRGRSGVDNPLFIDAILWMAGNAARWRDLPEVFGKWTGVHARFRRWSQAGVWEALFHALADTPDFEYVLIDNTISKVHADAAYNAGPLRALINDTLGATAQIAANPSRARKPPIDRRLYRERHQIECFFNRLKRFRRIALRCEKTLPAFMGFVHLACAMIWLRYMIGST